MHLLQETFLLLHLMEKKTTLDTTENIIFPFLSIQPSEQIIFAM